MAWPALNAVALSHPNQAILEAKCGTKAELMAINLL